MYYTKNIGALNSMAVVEEEITDNIREALVKMKS